MAARVFTKYESNSGLIHGIYLSKQVSDVANNAAPTGDIDTNIRVKISKSNREFGIRPRGVRISITVGAAPNTFKRYAFIPILDPANYDNATFKVGENVTYNGGTWTIIALVPEDY